MTTLSTYYDDLFAKSAYRTWFLLEFEQTNKLAFLIIKLRRSPVKNRPNLDLSLFPRIVIFFPHTAVVNLNRRQLTKRNKQLKPLPDPVIGIGRGF